MAIISLFYFNVQNMIHVGQGSRTSSPTPVVWVLLFMATLGQMQQAPVPILRSMGQRSTHMDQHENIIASNNFTCHLGPYPLFIKASPLKNTIAYFIPLIFSIPKSSNSN